MVALFPRGPAAMSVVPKRPAVQPLDRGQQLQINLWGAKTEPLEQGQLAGLLSYFLGLYESHTSEGLCRVCIHEK